MGPRHNGDVGEPKSFGGKIQEIKIFKGKIYNNSTIENIEKKVRGSKVIEESTLLLP